MLCVICLKRCFPDNLTFEISQLFFSLSPFAAHIHVDDEDFSGGCAGILTLENAKKKLVGERQLHYLPLFRQVGGPPNSNPGPGIAFHLEDSSVLLEASAVEFHGATRVEQPNFYNPFRLAAVCFCALFCDLPFHGHGVGSRDEIWKLKHHREAVSL